MLTLTDNAADIVKQIAEQVEDADGPGLRISEADHTPETGLVLAAVSAPEPGDQIIDDHGARVFLDQTAAAILDDKVLDAKVEPDGAVTFGLGQQA